MLLQTKSQVVISDNRGNQETEEADKDSNLCFFVEEEWDIVFFNQLSNEESSWSLGVFGSEAEQAIQSVVLLSVFIQTQECDEHENLEQIVEKNGYSCCQTECLQGRNSG